MMDFDDFKNRVVAEIREHLPIQYIDADISLKEVIKNNDVKHTGITIKGESDIAPNIYLEGFYEKYCNGQDMDSILNEVADVRVKHEVKSINELKDLLDLDKIKDKITCKLLNEAHNREYLSDKPYTIVEDLAVVYAVNLGNGPKGQMSAPITDKLLEQYGISKEELHDIALENLANSGDISFRSMAEVLRGIMFPGGSPEDIAFLNNVDVTPMYVLTNGSTVNGAAAILDKTTMDDIAKKLNGDYIVIPSSVNETIIVPMTGSLSNKELDTMVKEVNSTEVAVEDRLSDHVYMYDAVEHELVNPEKYAERVAARNERAADRKPDRERVSLKDKLSEKKAEVAKADLIRKPVTKDKAIEAVGLE